MHEGKDQEGVEKSPSQKISTSYLYSLIIITLFFVSLLSFYLLLGYNRFFHGLLMRIENTS